MMPNIPPPKPKKQIAPAMPNLPPPPAKAPAPKGPVVAAPAEDFDIDESDICPYFAEGDCQYGDSCWYIHAEPTKMPKVENDHKCGICLNKIRSSGKQYGLL